MTQLSPLALTQLLITRFCHDITGPVGAINNGMEVLAEDPSMHAQAMELIGQSAMQAGARIQFYRYLFGMLKSEGAADMNSKKELIDAFYQGSRIDVTWHACPDVMAQPECQVICNLLLIGGAALMRGGTVDITFVTAEGEALRTATIVATGPNVRLDEEISDALLHSRTHTPTAKSVQAYYTALLCAEQHGRLELSSTDSACILTYHAS